MTDVRIPPKFAHDLILLLDLYGPPMPAQTVREDFERFSATLIECVAATNGDVIEGGLDSPKSAGNPIDDALTRICGLDGPDKVVDEEGWGRDDMGRVRLPPREVVLAAVIEDASTAESRLDLMNKRAGKGLSSTSEGRDLIAETRKRIGFGELNDLVPAECVGNEMARAANDPEATPVPHEQGLRLSETGRRFGESFEVDKSILAAETKRADETDAKLIACELALAGAKAELKHSEGARESLIKIRHSKYEAVNLFERLNKDAPDPREGASYQAFQITIREVMLRTHDALQALQAE